MGQIKLRKQLKDSLYHKYEQGHGRAKTDKVHNGTEAIHSHNTYKTYMREVEHFAAWAKDKNIKDYDKAAASVPDYLDQMQADGKSAWTVSTALCALAKAFNRSTMDFNYELPKRHREDIRRSREHVERDKHFSPEKNQALIRFAESTGLRRRELEALKGSDMLIIGDRVLIHVQNGKGGKERLVEVVGHKQHVINLCKRAGSGKVFPTVHNGADIHYYRANYAKAIYNKYARNLGMLERHEKYYCRGDMKGQVFDRKAMKIASENLGHNRIDVIANNYMY